MQHFLNFGYWLLAIGYWLLAIGYLLSAIPHSLPLPCCQPVFQVAVQYKFHFLHDGFGIPAGHMLVQSICRFYQLYGHIRNLP